MPLHAAAVCFFQVEYDVLALLKQVELGHGQLEHLGKAIDFVFQSKNGATVVHILVALNEYVHSTLIKSGVNSGNSTILFVKELTCGLHYLLSEGYKKITE